MADKDYKYMASRIATVADKVFCIRPDNPRALSAEEYASVFESLGVSAGACQRVAAAVDAAIEYARSKNLAVVSLGSLYMYGEVASAVRENKNK